MADDNAQESFHESLRNIGWRVDELIRVPAVLELFKANILQWYLDGKRRDSEIEVWKQRREKHIDAILATPQLRDKSAAQKSGWEWWQTHRQTLATDDADSQLMFIEGWAPRELVRDEPPTYWPLPLSTERSLQLDEKYTLLAAIHDQCCEAVPKINPWLDGEFYGYQFSSVTSGSLMYCALYRRSVLDELEPRNLNAIETFLVNVQADIEQHTANLAGAGGSEGGKKTGPTKPKYTKDLEAKKALDLMFDEDGNKRDMKYTEAGKILADEQKRKKAYSGQAVKDACRKAARENIATLHDMGLDEDANSISDRFALTLFDKDGAISNEHIWRPIEDAEAGAST